MKLALPVFSALVASLVQAQVHQNDAIYYHSKSILGASVWHFSGDGLIVFNPEGDVLKQPPKSTVCQTYDVTDQDTNKTTTVDSCRFFELASDGHRYVWAGSRAATDQVEAYDIDTAEHVGHVSTCRVPMDLDYHPTRQEMFVHCHTGELEVFSSNSFASSEFGRIDLQVEGSPSGRFILHPTLGATGYSATSPNPFLIQVDLANRQVVGRHDLPLAAGARNMAYSPVNRHIFVRPRVCCTCGNRETSDTASCGGFRGPAEPAPVNITTGPSKGINVQGVCGTACEGSKADTIGVYEFDTVSQSIVGSHNINPAYGFGANPVSSPNGQYILLFGNDGGKAVKVLKPGANGKKSTQVGEILTNFEGLPGDNVITDFAFVSSDQGGNVLVLAATTDNDLALVDMNDDTFPVHKLAVSAAADSTAGSSRHVEWAAGTNYVWVTGGDAQELYIIEFPTASIADARLFKTISNIPAGEIIFVDNYERKATSALIAAQMGNNVATSDESARDAHNEWHAEEEEEDNDRSQDLLIITCMVIAVTSFLMSSVSLFKILSTTPQPLDDATTVRRPMANHRGSSGNDNDTTAALETKTLGSKMVA